VGEPPSESAEHAGDAPRRAHLLPTLDRFNAFSDGVFAIAITLLVLDLPVPPEHQSAWPALVHEWHEFLGYLISFVFIGSIWLTHAGMSRVMRKGDSISFGLNLLVLLFVALLPFSTRLMVTHIGAPDVRVGVLVYGFNVLLASLMLSLLMFYVAQEPALLVDRIADDDLKRLFRQRWSTLGVTAFAIVVALVAPLAAVALYLVSTAIGLALPLVALRRHRHKTR
jgi:TMEM175 potassium channel family protein